MNDEILHELGGGWDCPVALPAGAKGRTRLAPLQVEADTFTTTIAGLRRQKADAYLERLGIERLANARPSEYGSPACFGPMEQ